MEIKARLQKPYLEKERLDFIVQNNHNLGYEIRETDVSLEAWGDTDDERIAKDKETKRLARIAELKELLNSTDYITSKLSEGVATKEEYADQLAQREEWRKEIRQLMGED